MKRTTATVHGIMCSMCEKNAAKAVEENFDVKDVSVSCEQALLEILSEMPIDEAKLYRVLSAQGFILEEMHEEEASA